jgi:hypothetical protein
VAPIRSLTTPGINTCSCSPTIAVSTNSIGTINSWEIVLTAGEAGSENITTEDYYAGIFSGTVIRDLRNFDNTGTDTASNLSDAGSWVVTTALPPSPVPGAMMLVAGGLLTLDRYA